ncbi:glycosyltransferase family 9 protein, partial [bacterium]
YPALLSMKEQFKDVKFSLITTPAIKPFAETLNIFDRIIIINDSSFLKMSASSVIALIKVFKIDAFVDLEVYSRLSTIFSVLSMARNRIGFYLDIVFWRKDIFTHLIYFNRYAGSYIFYEQIAKLFGARILPDDVIREIFIKRLGVNIEQSEEIGNIKKIITAHACSSFASERMLNPIHWKKIFENEVEGREQADCIFIGGRDDKESADSIIELIKERFKNIKFKNICGDFNVKESVKEIYNRGLFIGIDSSMLHFARLLGVKSVSFWGPTDPESRIRHFEYLQEKVYYKKIACSPCAHIVDKTPCLGNNICIKNIFRENETIESAPSWIICAQKED